VSPGRGVRRGRGPYQGAVGRGRESAAVPEGKSLLIPCEGLATSQRLECASYSLILARPSSKFLMLSPFLRPPRYAALQIACPPIFS